PVDGSVFVFPGFIDFHAEHTPSNPWAVFQSAHDPGKIDSISYSQLAEATHRVAHALRPGRQGKEQEVVAIIINCDTVQYVATMAGMRRAGLVPFPMSPKNSPEAVCHMLRTTECHRLVMQTSLSSLVAAVKAILDKENYALELVELQPFHEVFPTYSARMEPGTSVTTVSYPPPATPRTRDDLAIYIHSSGSTGLPKSIGWTERIFLQWANSYIVRISTQFQLRWACMALPTFHSIGIVGQVLLPMVTGLPVSLFTPQAPAPPALPNPKNMLDTTMLTGANALASVPIFIELWCRSPETVKYLATLKCLCWAGGPLSQTNGDMLVKAGVNLAIVYGATETGIVNKVMDLDLSGNAVAGGKKPEDWSWMQFDERVITRWVDQGDGTFELQLLTSDTYKLSMENLTDVAGYATNDVFKPHPTQPGLWRIVGRVDDVIVLRSGEKVVPLPQEDSLNAVPFVSSAIMFGRGQSQPGVIIELLPEHTIDTQDDTAVISVRNKLWPYVEEANKHAPAFARLFKETIIIAHHSRPFARAAKGTAIRKLVIQAYQEEIDDILSATFLRNRVIATLRNSEDKSVQAASSHIPQELVFQYPTLARLSIAIATFINPELKSSLPQTLDEEIKAMISKHSENLPSFKPFNPPPNEDVVVLLTGSTGSLGAHVLASLLADDTIKNVITLNRGTDVEQRQKSAFQTRGLPTELLNSKKLRSLVGDMKERDLGLSEVESNDVRNCTTHIIHNAWRVDFNLSLGSFESYVASTRNLIDFSACCSKPVRLLFVSSVASCYTWDVRNGSIPEEVIDDTSVAAASGYGTSKYVAEHIIAEAARHGLSASSARVGQICGSTSTGDWNTSEWVPILVKTSLAMGYVPELKGTVSWLPIDITSRTIIEALLSNKSLPEVFNVAHPRRASWHDIITTINGVAGKSMHVIPLKLWVQKVEALSSSISTHDVEVYPAIKLLRFWRSLIQAEQNAEMHGLFGNGVEAAGLPVLQTTKAAELSGTLRDAPPLEGTEVKLWVQYWRNSGFI
ncbi:hypothetical protein BXZ70DRAFT_1057354, partial [Cristinia sonorae]